MNAGAYEIIALTARYIFAVLMALIVLRAWRITAVDSRRAASLRRISPETGICGELVVLEGGERAKNGMRYSVIREGMIGTSRRADIRIRHSSVRRRHAYFLRTEDGLKLRGHAGARLRDGNGRLVRELTLADGDHIGVGRVHLLLVLSEATAAQEVRIVPRRSFRGEPERSRHAVPGPVYDEDADSLFNVEEDDLFATNPLGSAQSAYPAAPEETAEVEFPFDVRRVEKISENQAYYGGRRSANAHPRRPDAGRRREKEAWFDGEGSE